MAWNFDYLIIGAGFSGLTMAERLATQKGATSLVVDKRAHIGGNAYDRYDDHGVLIHNYGPHYFRTNSPRIREYLSQFTEWHPVDYRILSWTDGAYWPFPINLNTFEQFTGKKSTPEEMAATLEKWREPVTSPANSEEVIVSQVGRELYKKFFEGYTLKQWRRHPRDLDASVCGRIPIRTNRDDRYLTEEFQALPAAGYTRMFERMIASCADRVKILLNTGYRDVLPHVSFKRMIYTGPVDEYFDFSEGRLPYRSLRFEEESFTPQQLVAREPVSGKKGFWQPAMQVNYPNDHDYTRIVEMKHATGQLCENTTIVREYPDDFGLGREPYYPIPAPDTSAVYARYKERADAEPDTSFIGRLATYKYYNMDQVVGMALAEFDRISRK
ncbi:MAG: UDP-galactopyranose mutase [Verrucomicrobiaceae bacterium]|nr:MAG: UDP-galactopyranose mutase [Verrucomicrobiaceae bacterium]